MAAKRKCSGSNKKTLELDSIFASGKHRESGLEKVDLIVHGKMSFLFTTELMLILLMIFIVDYPCLNSNLVETLWVLVGLD